MDTSIKMIFPLVYLEDSDTDMVTFQKILDICKIEVIGFNKGSMWLQAQDGSQFFHMGIGIGMRKETKRLKDKIINIPPNQL